MYHYLIDGTLCCTEEPLPYPAADPAAQPETAPVWLYREPLTDARASFCATDARQLAARGLALLNEKALPCAPALDAQAQQSLASGGLRAVNLEHPAWKTLLKPAAGRRPLRVNILAMGDVGGTLLTGLRLLGQGVIGSIGIFDVNENFATRWEFEANQISYPWAYDRLPEVEIITADKLFDGDVFVFVASCGVPAVGSAVKDVRMAQLELNRPIVEQYAVQARKAAFGGIFAVVSDPVDPLAKFAYLASNRNESGALDWQGLRAEQVQGFGLGVMNARAAYFAKRDPQYADFLSEGRVFGPHGQDLVVANSITRYDDAKSRALTEQVTHANMALREIGFKPYVAPALSSGALSLLLTLRGEWHYGSVYLGGAFLGVRNRYTVNGQQIESLPLPDALYARIAHAHEGLRLLGEEQP